MGLEGTVSNGIVSGIRKMEGFKFIQITAPISPGSSGGPVFNSTGKVIGVATAYLDIGQNLNFAMPVNYLRSLKPNRIKLSLLPKITPKGGTIEKDATLVEAFDIHYDYYRYGDEADQNRLIRIDFAIRNRSNYPVRNIKLFLVYKNLSGEVVSYSAKEIENAILPNLALQFFHVHKVEHFRKWNRKIGLYNSGSVEIRILGYEIDRTGRSSPADLLFK